MFCFSHGRARHYSGPLHDEVENAVLRLETRARFVG